MNGVLRQVFDSYADAVAAAKNIAAQVEYPTVVYFTHWAGWQIAPDARPVERLRQLKDVAAIALPDGTVRRA